MKESLQNIQEWASEIRQGNFSARLQHESDTASDSLTDDINRLAEWLESLAEDQEAQIQAQQSRLEHESSRVLRFEERTRLANELHDSLAQTLASLKIQVRVLDDTLRQDNEAALWQEMERIQATLDDANTEVRDLIAHFRSPLDRQGLVPAIEKTVSRLKYQLGVQIVLQNQWRHSRFDAETESQVLRIIQESLRNVGKHSEASMARVLLTYGPVGRCRVVIEDDGSGFEPTEAQLEDSEHFGLSIMHERAAAIGAELKVESEPGEGTTVFLEFDAPEMSAEPQQAEETR